MHVLLLFWVFLVVASSVADVDPDYDPFTSTQTHLSIETTIRSHQSTTRVLSTHLPPGVCQNFTGTNNETADFASYFQFAIPPDAYVSAFLVHIGPFTFPGVVLERSDAEGRFNDSDADITGLVLPQGNSQYDFKVVLRCDLVLSDLIVFELVFEEVLRRVRGEYSTEIYVVTNSGIRDGIEFRGSVDISSFESIGLKWIDVVVSEEAAIVGVSQVNFSVGAPSGEVGFSMPKESTASPLEFSIRFLYAIDEYAHPTGVFLLNGNYFVHVVCPGPEEVAPGDLLPKSIVFVLDVSGSMSGDRIAQAKAAFNDMIGRLDSVDRFNVISFSDKSDKRWRGVVDATSSNRNKAMSYVSDLEADGSTNINDAMIDAIDVLNDMSGASSSVGIVVLLSDGDPSEGVIDRNQIRLNVREANTNGFSVFTLAFGSGISMEFLQGIAEDNNGVARKIYLDSAVPEQLSGFFDEIRAVLYVDLVLDYNLNSNGISLTETTKTTYAQFYHGSEVVVVGEIELDTVFDPILDLDIDVSATGVSGRVEWSRNLAFTLSEHNDTALIDTERVFRYEKMREFLLKWAIDPIDQKRDNALNFALRHQLLTPLTAMYVEIKNASDIDSSLASGGGGDEEMASYGLAYLGTMLAIILGSVGGAIGGILCIVVLVAVIIIVVVCLRKKKRRQMMMIDSETLSPVTAVDSGLKDAELVVQEVTAGSPKKEDVESSHSSSSSSSSDD